jgi:hypothetical protein
MAGFEPRGGLAPQLGHTALQSAPMGEVRDADLPRDLEAVRQLWLDYLTWATMSWKRDTGSASR